jgi:membrane protein DedA with SNARE-associated domain
LRECSRRVTPTDDDEDIDVRFVSPKARGHLRLLAGMVRANRPWRLFSTMKGTLAAAFATAAHALVMPIIWQMADSLSWVRLLALMVLSLVAMVGIDGLVARGDGCLDHRGASPMGETR